MAKMKWENRGQTLGGYPCVTLPTNEKCIAGTRGEIWDNGPGAYKMFIVLPGGDEKIISFKSDYLRRGASRIGAPRDRRLQAQYANNPRVQPENG